MSFLMIYTRISCKHWPNLCLGKRNSDCFSRNTISLFLL